MMAVSMTIWTVAIAVMALGWARAPPLTASALVHAGARVHEVASGTCEPLTIPECVVFGYNSTVAYHNSTNVKHKKNYSQKHVSTKKLSKLSIEEDDSAQTKARKEMLQLFKPLLHYGCSRDLQLLLCSHYAPMCVRGRGVPPCRALCESVQSSCLPVIARFGYSWPAFLNCSVLPSGGRACVAAPPPPPTTATRAPCRPSATLGAADREFAAVWMAVWGVVCGGVTLYCLLLHAMWVPCCLLYCVVSLFFIILRECCAE